jgi:hypothetical protein
VVSRSTLPAPEDTGTAKVSSAVIFDQVKLLQELYGSVVLERASAALAAPLREEIAGLSPGSWLSVDAARELKNHVAALVDVPPLELQRLLSARGVERTLTTFWRFLLRQLGDEALAKRTPLIYSRTFSQGTFTATSWREGTADFELRGWRIPEYDLLGLVAGVTRILEVAGRLDVRVTTTRRATVVLMQATWSGRR